MEITFTINGKEITVPKGTTVYQAAKKMGVHLPIFCYQDRMPPFGACRVCLVEVDKMGKLQTSCTLQAEEGMSVHTESENAKKGREEILEFLLINHPLDCPVCDKGGECPLQDQVLEFGPGKSRFYEDKRHFKKPVERGPVLMLDRERCIACARCTRFGDEIAGDHALEFVERGFRIEVATPNDGPAESKFIGNTIAICPVGALTSQVYRFRARPWDNDSTETTCTLCPVGCSMTLDARDGEIMRTRPTENKHVNDMWLCDKGFFGYEFSSSAKRLQMPLIKENGSFKTATWDEALSLIAKKLKEAKKIGALGGDQLTVEENYLFQKLMRDYVHTPHIDHRVGEPIFSLEDEGLPSQMELTFQECEDLEVIILLGIDLTEEFPVLWLRLRQAINKGAKVLFMGHYAPEISKYCHEVILHPPGQELEFIKKHLHEEKGALFVGSQYLHLKNRKAILSALQKTRLPLNLLSGHGNSLGARFAGMRPDLNPFFEPVKEKGLNSIEILNEASKTGWDLLYVAGATIPSIKHLKKQIKFLVVQDLFLNETAEEADVVLPTLSFLEKEGTFINIEGRVQVLKPGKKIPENIYSDGEIFIYLAEKLGHSLQIDRCLFEKLKTERLLFPKKAIAFEESKNTSETDLKATFSHPLFDRGVRMRHNEHLIHLSKEPFLRIHPDEAKVQNVREGDVVTINNVLRGKIKLDTQVSLKTVVIPMGFPELEVHNLGPNLFNGMEISL